VSSLRPLATIALLAAVGVFLYMKINESEPKLSPELEEISTMTLDVGGDIGELSAAPLTTGSTGATPPALSAGDEAPPFSAVSVNPLPAASAPAAGDAAPAWSAGPPAGTTATPVVKPPAADTESSTVARTAVPDMPPLPAAAGSAALSPSPVSRPSLSSVGATAPAFGGGPTTPEMDIPEVETTPATSAAAATTPAATPKAASMFAAARVAVQGALDRGELAQALLLLSDWYGDPSLSPAESQEVSDLLSQLAGSVIYEGPPAHRLLPAHIVQAGETLESIADKYDIPWQLLAKINGIADPGILQPGHELKVLPGPFSALIDLSERKMTVMLERRYAGQFALEIEPTSNFEEGEWKVDQKLLTPAGGGVYGLADAEDRSLLLASALNPDAPTAIVRGPGSADPASAEPRDRVLRMKAADVGDVYDILSVGSRVTIRR
jgi:LysM repeat protein